MAASRIAAVAALCLSWLALSAAAESAALSPHTNTWAVLVDTSRFWFNYRHAANVYSVYHIVRRLGVPDSNIILMVADGMACDAQNPVPGTVYNDERQTENVYGRDIEVDYRGYEGKPPDGYVLPTQTEFAQFQDAGEISSYDFADAFDSMWRKGRYRELMVVADTCQGGTLHERLYSPNILMGGSSSRGENSWSHGSSGFLGTTMMDRFTHSTLGFFERRVFGAPKAVPSLADLLASYDPSVIDSHPSWNNRLKRPLKSIPVTDFFAFPHASATSARAMIPLGHWAAIEDAVALRARFGFRGNVTVEAPAAAAVRDVHWLVVLMCAGLSAALFVGARPP